MNFGSLFAGAGGFDAGFEAAGLSCAWQVEIDATCRSVLARHYPDVPRFNDVSECGKKNLARVDVVVGGFPCQDLSTAGKRKGFKGKRSSLFFEMARIVRELRPAYVVWENVPGLLTSAEGRDFLAVLVELDRLGFDGGWRTLDAQHFGVAQQRRRVFGVFARRNLGAERAAEILALTESSRRRTPKGRKTGTGVARDAAGGAGGGNLVVFGGGDTRGERCVSASLSAKGGTGRIDFDTENFVLIQDARAADKKGQGGLGVRESSVYDTLYSQGSQAVVIPIDMRQASRGELMTNNRREGSSGGAPGTGIGEPGEPSPTIGLSHVPAVCVGCQAPDATPKGRTDGLAYTLTARQTRGHGHGMAVCVTGERVRHALTGEGSDASEDGTGRGTPIVAFNPQAAGNQTSLGFTTDLAGSQGASQVPAIIRGPIVRRLTPRECERLQGWDDDWTRYREDGTEIKDGPRYRMIGNGVPKPFSLWLGRRLLNAGGAA